MPQKKGKGSRGERFDITGLTDFRPPPLSQNVVLNPPDTPPNSNPVTPSLQSSSSPLSLSNAKKQSTSSLPTSSSRQDASSSSLLPPSLNLNEPAIIQQQQNSAEASTKPAVVNNNSSNNSNNSNVSSLWKQLSSNTGGILFHHTTDKDYHLKNKHGSSKHGHHKTRAVESERLLYVLNVYQFVISPDSLLPQVHPEILKAMLSFDEFPSWSHICAVVQNGEFEEFTCPICLDTPQAPRMTLCGHVFCGPCWSAHSTERINVALKQKAKSSGLSGDESRGMFTSSASSQGNNIEVPCPVCSKLSFPSSTKPLLFVPSANSKLESNKKPVEFTRLQRLRRAPVFFRPKPENDGVVVMKDIGEDIVGNSANNNSQSTFPTSASFDMNATPLTTVTTNAFDNAAGKSNNNNSRTVTMNNSTGGMFPSASSSSFPIDTISNSNSHQQTELLDIIPSLCLDNADDATLCSRYVAFNGKILKDWAEGQMISLSEQKIEVEGSLAAVIASSGPDTATTEKANPMALALQSQLAALDQSIHQLSEEVRVASKAPSPFPTEFAFPAGLIDQTSSPENVVDVYRRSGTGMQLFLHPMSTRMLQENAIVKHEKLPERVSCCVDDVESITQNAEHRKHKSFSHIPLGASYQVAFSDLRGRLVPEVAKQFEQSVDDRREKINKMLHREAKVEKKAEEYMNYVNQVRAERDQQLLMDFGYSPDLNSTSMLNDADIAKRNAEAFAVNVEDNYEKNQQKNENRSSSKQSAKQKQQQHSWKENLPSLSDLPTTDANNLNDDDYLQEQRAFYHSFSMNNANNSSSNAAKSSKPVEDSDIKKKPIFIKLGGGTSSSSLACLAATTKTSPPLGPSTSQEQSPAVGSTTSEPKGVWGKSSSSLSDNNTASPGVGKPLSFSEMMKKKSNKK